MNNALNKKETKAVLEERIKNLLLHENPRLYHKIIYQDIQAFTSPFIRRYLERKLNEEYSKYQEKNE